MLKLTSQRSKDNGNDKGDRQCCPLVETLWLCCPTITSLNHWEHILNSGKFSAVENRGALGEDLVEAGMKKKEMQMENVKAYGNLIVTLYHYIHLFELIRTCIWFTNEEFVKWPNHLSFHCLFGYWWIFIIITCLAGHHYDYEYAMKLFSHSPVSVVDLCSQWRHYCASNSCKQSWHAMEVVNTTGVMDLQLLVDKGLQSKIHIITFSKSCKIKFT